MNKKPQSPGKKSPRSSNKNNPDQFHWKRAGKTSLIWISIILCAVYISGLLTESGKKEIEIEYTEYREYLENHEIQKAVVIGVVFHGEFKLAKTLDTPMGALENVTHFKLTLPFVDRSVTDEWDAAELNYTFKEKTIDWTGYLLNMLPWLLLIGFWIFMIRRMQGGAGGMKGIFNFGKSRASLWTSDQPAVTFKDVAGCEEAKEELKEVIGFLKNPKRFQKLGATVPKGALLIGPPGTGKTLLARAVAGEASVPFYSLSGADFVEMFVGVGASRVRDLFEQAKKTTPCIIFIDELDAVGRQRGAGIGGGHDEREQTLNALLVEMDGFDNTQNVIVIAATNRPDVLDKALLRPGRFDRQIVVDVPDYIGRLGILKVHTKKVVLNRRKVDLESLAKGTPGMVGADLANIVNEAALLAARKRKRSIDNDDFEEAKDKVMMGIQRKSMVLSEEEKEVTAYHEAGHALVAMRTKGADPVHKITIIPRGRAMGITMQLPIDERHGYTRDYVEGRLGILMGGRSAEMLIFNQMTTGAGNDIEQATEIARKMVVEWGMSDLLGPMTFGKKNEEIFLGREIQSHRDYSDVTARMIDEEISRIVRDAQRISEEILRKDIDLLNRLAKELLKYETVTSDDLDKIIKGQKLTRRINGQSRQKPRKRTPGKSRRKVQAKQNKAGLRKPGNQSQSKQKKKQPAKK
ncbi:MAG: ATP-dependent zinc metalloprotease FtsH [Candidatus Marinimicrobia bacterium]|nr:ATP-dependent zinc metalloprotease FtsH [Candidatus Neomarinimicrobiota bacterium]MDP6613817.1 ATP-dependent zinc metalloprotease FtsH [Candidatus Neomarinimicrobiota bacterium]|tara:strand:+ start:3249 stop:5321 length:2073 start_codon:yes stop_codon:yes gene_type:complete